MRGLKPELRSGFKGSQQLHIPRVPIEWLDASSWRLPSGKALAEFALQTGFLAPLLFKTETLGLRGGTGLPARNKQLGKEGNR
jgi:hypothetical protein